MSRRVNRGWRGRGKHELQGSPGDSAMGVEPEVTKVKEANAAFYAAFESLQIERMKECWLQTDHIQCIHPGWPPLSGWRAVMASWDAIFRNPVQIRFDLSDVKVHVKGDLAWVLLTENIATPLGDERTITPIVAVNLFERVEDRWLMVHHHASHILADPQRFY